VAPRFLIDENLSPQLARHLRFVQGYDAVHVNEIGLQGARDDNVLARAIAEGRIVVTSNAEDFRRLGRRLARASGAGDHPRSDRSPTADPPRSKHRRGNRGAN
jgi:uncharacterized protein with PIN domain